MFQLIVVSNLIIVELIRPSVRTHLQLSPEGSQRLELFRGMTTQDSVETNFLAL